MTHKKLKSLHGQSAYLSAEDILVGNVAVGAGGQKGKASVILPGSPDYTAIWDDFHGSYSGLTAVDTGGKITIQDTGHAGLYFNVVVADDGSSSAIVAGTNGIYRFTGSATANGAPTDSERGMVGKTLNWKADQGPGQGGHLRLAARIKRNKYAAHGGTSCGALFVGFTDVLTVEFPIWDTGAADTGGVTQASDAVGIIWTANGDTGFVGCAIAGDVEKALVPLTNTAPTANEWVTLEVEISSGTSDTGGLATFYVDGVAKGQIVGPVTSNVALAPCIYHWDTGSSDVLDVDWINVSAPRDTGV